MKRITPLIALVLLACNPSKPPAPKPAPAKTAAQPPKDGFGNILVRDANGSVRTYKTDIDGSGIQTPHVIIDSMPAVDVGGITISDVNQGTKNASQAQAWWVRATDGTNALGDASHPWRVDPTGTTTQPVSVSSLPLPTGAATETTLNNVLTTNAFQARVPANGQTTMSGSIPVVLASNQSTLNVNDAATSSTGSAVPSKAIMCGGTAGGTLRALAVDSAGQVISVGPAGEGALASSSPLRTAGMDGSGLLHTFKTSSDGTVQIDGVPPSSSAYMTQLSVSTSAVRIDSGNSHALTRGFYFKCNSGGGDVYAGTSSGVTTSNGYKIEAGGREFFEEPNTNLVYFIASGGTIGCQVYAK